VEMANVISGPYAGMLLADLGAEVIKVELPGQGDSFRMWGLQGSGAPFSALNRDKKSVTLDVKKPAGRDAYLRLCRSADAVVENFRPGVLDRLGVGFDAVSAENPSIVYMSVSGMGSSGPLRDRPTFDAVAQALSGLWSQFTDLADPEAIGPAVADQVTGLYAALGILAGLAQRGSNGKGARLEVSMLGAALGFQFLATTDYIMNGTVADRTSRAQASQTFAFVDSNSQPFAIHLSSPPKFWTAMLDAIERPDLADDPRFQDRASRAENYDVLRAELTKVFTTRTRDEWLDRLATRDVPAAPLNTIDEALHHPQVQSLAFEREFGEGDRALRLLRTPIGAGDDEPASVGLAPPELGEHNDIVFRGLGYSDEQLEGLRSDGAI
jgi:crotonobetainyl-CoA:carnitine CoA-transferase CaiB-like acyl-CoA transferase